MWQPLETLRNTVADGNGLVRLWADPNYMQSQNWTTKEGFGEKIYYYFFVPNGFYQVGEDQFAYNFSFNYVNKSEDVTGWVSHNGRHDLNEGKTVPFWHLEQAAKAIVTIQTDDKTKLPYLIVPNRGDPDYFPERRYFIPVGENY